MPTWLEPAFVRELEALRRKLVIKTASGRAGEHLSRRRGGSAEFAEHRPYEWGDDPRRIDWLAFARTGEPVVKQFRADEDVILRVLLDTSGSLEGEKLDRAARIAAALGYIGLAQNERVQLIPFADRASVRSRPHRGRGGLPALLRTLDGIVCEGTTSLASAVETSIARGRPGMLAVISDFLDPSGFEAPLARARAAGHELLLVQVLTPEELEPPWSGDVDLEDAETGERVTLTADVDTIEAYRARLHGLFEMLRGFARKHGATYVRGLTNEPLEAVVRRVVDRRVDP